ncbi:MAG: ABA4-like family protein [Chloroflexi bacterium]|nr:ABA4-like family protein [Chloroflexota bacterium]
MFNIIFQLSNLWIMPFWALMIFLPHWHWTKRLMTAPWMVAVLALAYSVLVLPQALAVLPLLANPTLPGIAGLLGTPAGAAIGWIHFLAFDLFVGRWVYLDSRARRLTAWLASPALFFVLLFGPFGFLLYWGLANLAGHKTTEPITTLEAK